MWAGSGEVRFRDVSYRDSSLKRRVNEQLSSNYQMLRLTPFYYSFASGAADFDRAARHPQRFGPLHFPRTGLHEGAGADTVSSMIL